MTTRPGTAGRAILRVAIDRRLTVPLTEQIYESIVAAIRERRLRAGAPLPSTRALAHDLSVARSTVSAAYDQLRAEEYLEGARGRVARVSARIDAGLVTAAQEPRVAQPATPVRLSTRGRHVWEFPFGVMGEFVAHTPRPFRSGVPALDVFPVALWGRLLARAWRRGSPRSLGYGEAQGYPPLRAAIAHYLRTARGINCTEDQIVICSGAQQAIDLTARALLDEEDEVWVEDPGYVGAQAALVANGLRVTPIPVDDEGLDVAAGIRMAPTARMAHVTSARQAPLGVAMSGPRRHALLAWAAESGAWVFEDDYDSELQYASRPPVPLYALDNKGCVILAGTFSKVLFPALRLGYLVTPPELAAPLARTKMYADVACPHLHQAVLADFISEGHFERHIRKMRGLYQRRQELLVRLLRRRIGASVEISKADAGMNLVLWLPPRFDDQQVADAGRTAGLDLLPLSRITIRNKPRARPGLLLGFGGIREKDLADGVETLAALLRSR